MNSTAMPEKKIHEGRNIKRIREMLGIKQEVLASDLNMSQQSVSLLESKEVIDPAILEEVAKILKVPVEALKNLTEESVMNIISNTFSDNHYSAFCNSIQHYNPSFNPLDKVVELYERLLKVEREKNELLQGKRP